MTAALLARPTIWETFAMGSMAYLAALAWFY